MKLPIPGQPHLTYCTNIHPAETWDDVRTQAARYLPRVKAHVAPDQPFGVGLRLSAQAAEELANPTELESFQAFLEAHGLYVFTLNGFPYGAFYETRVKERVYLPDWTAEARLRYTDRLATLLARLLPEGVEGSISTVPGAFRAHVTSEADVERMAHLMVRHLATLHRIETTTGKSIALALEPEPCCYLETTAQTVEFFTQHLLSPAALGSLSRLTGLNPTQSEAFLRAHLGVCVDACHLAVEFEEPGEALRLLRREGIRLSKIQLSAGLKIPLAGRTHHLRNALRPFANDTYLHQVVERNRSGLTRYPDLPEGLEALGEKDSEASEWRIHFHVPCCHDRLGPFHTTQQEVQELLDVLREDPLCQHLEVEIYTWHLLPKEHRPDDLVTAISRELRWVLGRLVP